MPLHAPPPPGRAIRDSISDGLKDLPITHLVVGDPRALVLGRPVRLAPPPATGPGRRDSASWLAMLFAGATGALAGTVSLAMVVWLTPAAASKGLPVRPVAVAHAVHVVAASYVPEAVDAEAGPGHGGAAQTAAAQEQATAPLHEPPVLAEAQATAPLPFLLPGAAPARAPREQHPVPVAPKAQAAHHAGRASPAPRQAAAGQGPAAQAVQALPSAVVLDAPPPQLASESRPGHASGLVAITPDSKLAVFTDPGTGLPRQFRIGDPLPGGDTIRSIDGGQGRVVTSRKEYSLD